MCKQSQTVLDLLVAFFFEILFHLIETIEELEQSNQTADDFDLQEAFLFGLVLC